MSDNTSFKKTYYYKEMEYRQQYQRIIDDVCEGKRSIKSVIDMIRGIVSLDTDAQHIETFELAVSNMDYDTSISFQGKHFVISGFYEMEEKVKNEIEKRGGIIHSSMVKSADYLIVYLECPGRTKVKKALEWRGKGVSNHIISDYQFWKAIRDTTTPVISDEKLGTKREQDEAKRIAAEEEQKKIKLEAKTAKEKKKEEQRKSAEELLRLAKEARTRRDEARRKKEETAQMIADEKVRPQTKRDTEKREKERAATEAKAPKVRERREAIVHAKMLYAPGQEPENIRRHIRTLCEKLDAAYPDHRISELYNKHKKWGETVTAFRKILGYADDTSFLEAYGYTVVVNDNEGGRPTITNPDEIIAELKRRYPNGAGPVNIQTLMDDNPDLPWKTLQNNATTYWGETLVAHLKTTGMIGGAVIQAPNLEYGRDQQIVSENSVDPAKDQEERPVESEPVEPRPVEESDEPVSDQAIAETVTETVDTSSTGDRTPELTESDKKYLSAIVHLSQSGAAMKANDIAAYLCVPEPSVSIALKKLIDEGVVMLQPNGSLAIATSADPTASPIEKGVATDTNASEETGLYETEERVHREAEEKAKREAEEQKRREAEEKPRQEAKEQAHHEDEETQRKAVEAKRIAEKVRISTEILNLTNEMNSLKGLFAGIKRKKLQKQIDDLNDQLCRI